ncbi:thioesterase family protein [Patulibacter sp. NPDC049589]|uniref:acyl-CoA thioesterase n=1 Tax=Patulibacter sp. NPDC049589 TaxID=3154731 RepID=UPI003426F7C2
MTTDRGHVTRVTIPLRHRDMDTLGHLNQSMYHVFLEEARAKVLFDLLGEGEIRYVLARVELDHRHEVRMSDVAVHAEAWVSHVGRSSVRLGTRVVVGDDDLVAAEGSTVMVGWDRERRGSRPLDPDERELLLAAQGVAS